MTHKALLTVGRELRLDIPAHVGDAEFHQAFNRFRIERLAIVSAERTDRIPELFGG
jgi:hypothetical protein